MNSGVAKKQIDNLEIYKDQLSAVRSLYVTNARYKR